MQIDPAVLGASSGLAGATYPGATPISATPAAAPNGPGAGTQLQRPGTSGAYGMNANDFMTLFLAQLKNQDPTQPMSNSDMVAQLAQFTMINTLTNVQQALSGTKLAQSASLIGKTVTGLASDGSTVSGVVQQLNQSNGVLSLIVSGQSLSPDAITAVTPTATGAASSTPAQTQSGSTTPPAGA